MIIVFNWTSHWLELTNNWLRWTWMWTNHCLTFTRGYSLSGQLRVQEVTRLLPLCLRVTVERKRLHTPDLPWPCPPRTHSHTHSIISTIASSHWTSGWSSWLISGGHVGQAARGDGDLISALTCEWVTWPLLSPVSSQKHGVFGPPVRCLEMHHRRWVQHREILQ